MRSKLVIIPIYEQRLLFIEHFNQYNKVNKLIESITGIEVNHTRHESGLTMSILEAPELGNRQIMVIICNSKSKTETLEILAHELFHATVTLCEYLGITVTEDSGQEAGAYIQGWLFKILYKHVLERKK